MKSKNLLVQVRLKPKTCQKLKSAILSRLHGLFEYDTLWNDEMLCLLNETLFPFVALVFLRFGLLTENDESLKSEV